MNEHTNLSKHLNQFIPCREDFKSTGTLGVIGHSAPGCPDWDIQPLTILHEEKSQVKAKFRSYSINISIYTLQIQSSVESDFPLSETSLPRLPFISLLPTTPPNTHSCACSTIPPTLCPPILLVSLAMLPRPLPTHFSAPLYFGHSYIYGVIWCSSPSKASGITAHTGLWQQSRVWGGWWKEIWLRNEKTDWTNGGLVSENERK